MNIITLCGSLGAKSSNQAALDHAGSWMASQGLQVSRSPQADTVPAFDPSRVDVPPPEVVTLQRLFESSDALMLSAPEYAAGVSGSMKNLLDWMVGSGSLYHRPVAIMSVGTTGGRYAIEQLVRTLSWQGALCMAVLGIDLPRTRVDGNGRFPDRATERQIEHWAATLLSALQGDSASRHTAVDAVVSAYGIDVSRFGDIP